MVSLHRSFVLPFFALHCLLQSTYCSAVWQPKSVERTVGDTSRCVGWQILMSYSGLEDSRCAKVGLHVGGMALKSILLSYKVALLTFNVNAGLGQSVSAVRACNIGSSALAENTIISSRYPRSNGHSICKNITSLLGGNFRCFVKTKWHSCKFFSPWCKVKRVLSRFPLSSLTWKLLQWTSNVKNSSLWPNESMNSSKLATG